MGKRPPSGTIQMEQLSTRDPFVSQFWSRFGSTQTHRTCPGVRAGQIQAHMSLSPLFFFFFSHFFDKPPDASHCNWLPSDLAGGTATRRRTSSCCSPNGAPAPAAAHWSSSSVLLSESSSHRSPPPTKAPPPEIATPHYQSPPEMAAAPAAAHRSACRASSQAPDRAEDTAWWCLTVRSWRRLEVLEAGGEAQHAEEKRREGPRRPPGRR
jgi:hypothetical protein